ncbi:hypothetical protein MP638_006279 [Amoeboaphelidium occidentale]|nr:hypothetical protein MP638_006279 [Amoeboaphelidium occidentale]
MPYDNNSDDDYSSDGSSEFEEAQDNTDHVERHPRKRSRPDSTESLKSSGKRAGRSKKHPRNAKQLQDILDLLIKRNSDLQTEQNNLQEENSRIRKEVQIQQLKLSQIYSNLRLIAAQGASAKAN